MTPLTLMIRVNGFEITESLLKERYGEIEKIHKEHLESAGVHLPNLIWGGEFKKKGVNLVCLSLKGKDGKFHVWHDSELKKVFKYLDIKNPEADNQARHLANVNGWYLILGSRQNDMRGKEFKFHTLKKSHPDYIPDRRDEGDLEWNQLLEKYSYKCPLTGKEHTNSDPLHKGHMDPRGSMDMENVVPMDPDFNRAIKDKFILNEKAIPKKATPQHTLDCLEEYLNSGEIDESEIQNLLSDD